jgi:hypothetical protein
MQIIIITHNNIIYNMHDHNDLNSIILNDRHIYDVVV